jgi:hypothetical protein
MIAATLPIVLILLSIVLLTISGLHVFRCYRRKCDLLRIAKASNKCWADDYFQLMDRLHEVQAKRAHLQARIELLHAKLRKATARVAEEKRDRLFWQFLFRQVAGTLSLRNRENHQLTLERDIAVGEFNRLAKQKRASKSLVKTVANL